MATKKSSEYLTAAISTNTSGAGNTLISGTPGKTIRVFKMVLSLASGTVIFNDGTTALSGAITTTQLVVDGLNNNPLYVISSGNDFKATLSGANLLAGTIWYQQS